MDRLWGEKKKVSKTLSMTLYILVPWLLIEIYLQLGMGIQAVLVINNHGQPRLTKFYEHDQIPFSSRETIVREVFQLVSKRTDTVCNFLEGYGSAHWGRDIRLIYRHYATLFFVFAVDESESELGVLDLIQVFVESLDKCFENVCELDLIFHSDKVHFILDEICMAGCVLETSLKEIIKSVNGTIRYETAAKASQLVGPTQLTGRR